MLIRLCSDSFLRWDEGSCRAAIGSGGRLPARNKVEGDGVTPVGSWPLRRVLYRKDRIKCPRTCLPTRAILPSDGWCDASSDPAYNQPVRLPWPTSAERLYRKDHVYDLLVVLGHNDGPPQPGYGSAVFLHLARENYSPTRGCVAIAEPDLRKLLFDVPLSANLRIEP